MEQSEAARDQPIRLPDLPLELRWQPPPERWDHAGGVLTVRAAAGTDLFVDPSGTAAVRSAPRLLGWVAGDFLLGARVTVDFAARFDAGALLLYLDEDHWAKLCFEYAPRNEPTVVSVVTRGLSGGRRMRSRLAFWLNPPRATAARLDSIQFATARRLSPTCATAIERRPAGLRRGALSSQSRPSRLRRLQITGQFSTTLLLRILYPLSRQSFSDRSVFAS